MSEFFGLLIICIILALGACMWDSYSCGNRARQMGFQSEWGLSTGCMIKTQNGWVDIDHYRVLQ